MSSSRTAVTLASTAIALLLAGCGGSTGAATDSAPATGPNPCELIGDQEAADLGSAFYAPMSRLRTPARSPGSPTRRSSVT